MNKRKEKVRRLRVLVRLTEAPVKIVPDGTDYWGVPVYYVCREGDYPNGPPPSFIERFTKEQAELRAEELRRNADTIRAMLAREEAAMLAVRAVETDDKLK